MARIVQGDRVTENGNLAAIQRFFRRSMDYDFSGDKKFYIRKIYIEPKDRGIVGTSEAGVRRLVDRVF